ncbi:MAG TPA: PIN domain-containing protein [Candidatus Acidoferrales bacterium]|nr:PIN domain-containing protein [Candidatus Acidoferrales bacterium]
MSRRSRIRLFLDSNVLTGGIVSPWGLDKAVLSLCAARICRLVLADVVRDEVEENLLIHAARLTPAEADELIEYYRLLIKLTSPETVPYPGEALVRSSRHLIRHAADVPVLLSAVASKPDWLLTHNTRHFTPAVAKRAGVRIATPAGFFTILSSLLT